MLTRCCPPITQVAFAAAFTGSLAVIGMVLSAYDVRESTVLAMAATDRRPTSLKAATRGSFVGGVEVRTASTRDACCSSCMRLLPARDSDHFGCSGSRAVPCVVALLAPTGSISTMQEK